MTEIQIILFSCIGILLFLLKFFRNVQINEIVKGIFTLSIFLNIVFLIWMLLLKYSSIGQQISYPFHKVSTFILGGFLASLMISLIFSKKKNELYPINSLVVQSSLLMATYFLGTGIVKLIHYKSVLAFFELSGYNLSFLFFIAAVEIIGAIGLLLSSARKYAAILLFINMLGATYTHYHNYFSSNIPDPFINSIDSLKMQPFLIFISLIGFGFISKQRMNKEL